MDATALNHYVKSVLWNVDTPHLVECISKGVDVSAKAPLDVEGWQRVGRYAAGKESAWVQAHKMRCRWPNLDTDVRGTDGEWKAEVWVRVKRETTA